MRKHLFDDSDIVPEVLPPATTPHSCSSLIAQDGCYSGGSEILPEPKVKKGKKRPATSIAKNMEWMDMDTLICKNSQLMKSTVEPPRTTNHASVAALGCDDDWFWDFIPESTMHSPTTITTSRSEEVGYDLESLWDFQINTVASEERFYYQMDNLKHSEQFSSKTTIELPATTTTDNTNSDNESIWDFLLHSPTMLATSRVADLVCDSDFLSHAPTKAVLQEDLIGNYDTLWDFEIDAFAWRDFSFSGTL
ncbi:hypothetical protein L2E82_26989 [Cichorium intybus]|uniref:Uncharacterized protein n=1 Tax=Cichorium intybus TaxID=13427 RepID=A0ACB9CRU9_CICIN|nr:hypothetical protein L2E82_26989 [Cichorium intybus]